MDIDHGGRKRTEVGPEGIFDRTSKFVPGGWEFRVWGCGGHGAKRRLKYDIDITVNEGLFCGRDNHALQVQLVVKAVEVEGETICDNPIDTLDNLTGGAVALLKSDYVEEKDISK